VLWFAIGFLIGSSIVLPIGLIVLIRQFINSNPEMRESAKKAVSERATQLINRVLK
jgi:hypothetical protein